MEARKVPKKKEPIKAPVAVKPAAEAKTVPDAEMKAVPDVEVKAPDTDVKAVPYAELSVPDAEVEAVPEAESKAGPDYLRTQIEGIDSKLKAIDEKTKPVDLKSIDDKMMFTIAALGELNKNLASVEKEICMLSNIAKIFVGIGGVGVIVFILYTLRMIRVI
jgi:hypothetical protein